MVCVHSPRSFTSSLYIEECVNHIAWGGLHQSRSFKKDEPLTIILSLSISDEDSARSSAQNSTVTQFRTYNVVTFICCIV